jgi:hypothetical protein
MDIVSRAKELAKLSMLSKAFYYKKRKRGSDSDEEKVENIAKKLIVLV